MKVADLTHSWVLCCVHVSPRLATSARQPEALDPLQELANIAFLLCLCKRISVRYSLEEVAYGVQEALSKIQTFMLFGTFLAVARDQVDAHAILHSLHAI